MVERRMMPETVLETNAEATQHLASHSVHCPSCQKVFSARFGRFGHSNYCLVGCDACSTMIALSDLDPVFLYLEEIMGEKSQEMQAAIARALIDCPCGGKFRVFDDRRRCPLCKASMKEVQISGQVPGLGPEMRPITGRLISPTGGSWAHLDFLRNEVEKQARQFESSPQNYRGVLDKNWHAKQIYDNYFRKITPEKLQALAPARSDLFFVNSRLFHDHGGARGPWWRFWSREILYPEKCGLVFDIDQKELKCSACGMSFPTRVR